MGTNRPENKYRSTMFKSPREYSRHPKSWSAFLVCKVYLWLGHFQTLLVIKTKRELILAPSETSGGLVARPRHYSWSGDGTPTNFPFGVLSALKPTLCAGLTVPSRSTHSCPIDVHTKPFSTSASKDLI